MDCETCKKEMKKTEPVPYLTHESAMARNERTLKRLIIALIIAIVFIFASNAAWLYAWCQYDYESTSTIMEYQQDGECLNIIGDRNMAGVFNNESESSENDTD